MAAADDIRKLTVQEIEQRLLESKEELWRLRFRATTEQLDSPLLIRHVRRDIARMTTVLNEHRQGIRAVAESDEGTPS